MDISRAKTVLIAAFLILNMFLFYQLWQEEGGHLLPLSGEGETTQLEEALAEANLTLKEPLPRGGERMAHLIVEPQGYGREEIKNWLLESYAQKENGVDSDKLTLESIEKRDSEEEIFLLDDLEVIIAREGIIELKKQEEKLQDNRITPAEMQQVVEDFFEEVPFFEGLLFDYAREGETWLEIYYHQEYEEHPLFAGYLRLEAVQETIKAYFYPLNPLGLAEQEREVISPLAALLRFLEEYGTTSSPRTVEEVSLGYYSPEYDAERWEIPPVWRIRLDNGEVFYVNAFTGHLEN